MSLRYLLLVTGPAYGTEQSGSALLFARALLVKEYQLVAVFFYADGVNNGNSLITPASDEFNLVSEWLTLSQMADVRLELCVAAALRRGVVDSESAAQYELLAANLQDGFTISGLGGLAQAMLCADRVVQF